MKRIIVESKETGRKSKVIVFNRCQWEKIHNRVSKSVDQAIEAANSALEREDRRQQSKEMAATWENTLQNLRKIRLQQREERIKKEDAEIQEKYKAMKKEQEDIKKEIKRKAKEILFEQRDSTKMLRSAQKLSQVYKERDAQIAFEEKMKEQAKIEEREEIRRMYEDIRLFHEEEEEKKKKFWGDKEKKKKEFAVLLKQIAQEKREEKERILAEGKTELMLMKAEIDQIHFHEIEELERKKRLCTQYMEDGMRYYRKYQQALLEDEKDETKAIAIIARGKATIAEKRKQKEDENLKTSLEKKANLATQLSRELIKNDNKEEENYQRAVAEQEAIWEKNNKMRVERDERLRRERIEAHLAYLKEDSENKEQEMELFKWAILQRLKNEEVTKELQDEIRRKKLKRILLCQETNRKLTMEFNEKMAKEKQEDVDAVKRAIDLWLLEDKEFLEFANKVKEECKAKNQTVYPIDTAIHRYKLDNGLLKRKRGVGLVEVPQIYPQDVEVERPPPKNKCAQANLAELQRKADMRKMDPQLRAIESKLQECLCVRTGRNGLDVKAKRT